MATAPVPQSGTGKERGREVTRIEAFVDAAFAFAVTLLVISFNTVPDSAQALVEALKGVPAFAASFALLAMLWWSHADWSRRYGLDDGRSVLLSLLLVFLVLVYVYPLRIIFTSFFGAISGGWLPAGIAIHGGRDLQLLFLAYAIAWTTLGFVMVALYRHAWRQRDALGLSREERLHLRGAIAGQWMIPATGALSMLVIAVTELLDKPFLAGMSGFAYGLMALTGLAVTRARRRAEAEAEA
ncbi:TMEM175 family protein [Luteimonas sp. 50]|uniref:TMEM175 family protein n=1 Tax=Cognatiluteimonas sedimenti TaxID=2927791 RepID=A0ABT0A6N3_9GAMM|nr:TMEM175 family protein [Lysobacter sedimenti]MCJ0826653.1 TMEM175 family protein [Lysobacter sedimenti]